MPQQAWSDKRERQYEHIKDSAEEIAARTVNKNRARAGESREASRTSLQDMSPRRRGGIRSGNRLGPDGPTEDQLYNEAKQRNVEGGSKMSKKELQRALGR
ncbi:plasmid stabilization protein [Amycolatopsis sp. WAC 01375]|uniref:plasmid stabilization protein n=1 Tax=Amycolatopsis sp. WAC 01375 TaxID=2203194 RepID=UPI000F781E5F|nr:plasmid stabilization protein [Amycolatopsis sp. WAC 01375]RSM72443.1 plasmid stabilization protein [Amycolatopsis sp. WAC 01375]